MTSSVEPTNILSLHVIESFIDKETTLVSITLREKIRKLAKRREVYRGSWQNKTVIIKCYLPNSKQQKDVQREWAHLKKLYSLGLKVAKPLLIGSERNGTFCIVIEEIKEGIDLQTLLFNKTHERSLRHLIFQELMTILAQQHAAGVYQSDNHLGNLLWDGNTLYAVDASSFCFEKAPLNLAKCAENLAWLFIAGKMSWEDELETFLSVYLDELNNATLEKQLKEKLFKKMPSLRKKRLLKYLKKTNRSSSAFEKKQCFNRTILFDRTLPSTLQQALLEKPDLLVTNSPIIKNGNTSTVASFTFEGCDYIIKRYNPKPFFYCLRHYFFPSRARRSWCCGLAWQLLGLPSPYPYACVEEKKGFLINKAFIVFEKVDGERLDVFVSQHKEKPEQLHTVAKQLAELWQLMGKVKAIHGDMKASNLLVSKEGGLSMIDFDHAYFFAPDFYYQWKRRKEWARFLENWKNEPVLMELFNKALTANGRK